MPAQRHTQTLTSMPKALESAIRSLLNPYVIEALSFFGIAHPQSLSGAENDPSEAQGFSPVNLEDCGFRFNNKVKPNPSRKIAHCVNNKVHSVQDKDNKVSEYA